VASAFHLPPSCSRIPQAGTLDVEDAESVAKTITDNHHKNRKLAPTCTTHQACNVEQVPDEDGDMVNKLMATWTAFCAAAAKTNATGWGQCLFCKDCAALHRFAKGKGIDGNCGQCVGKGGEGTIPTPKPAPVVPTAAPTPRPTWSDHFKMAGAKTAVGAMCASHEECAPNLVKHPRQVGESG
jgi:hypothetical protein